MLITCWTKQVMDIMSIIFYSPVFQPPVHRLSNLLRTKNRDIFNDRLITRALKGRAVRGLMGAYSSENFEMLMLQNATVSSVLRGQFRSKMFGKSIVIFMLVFRNTSEKTLFQKGTVNIGNIWDFSSMQIEADGRTYFLGLKWPIRFHNLTKTFFDILTQ